MTSKIVTLKDSTGTDICYPITPVDAVFVDNNTTLSDALNDKADADMSNVASNTISASKLDLSTFDFGNYSTSEVNTGFTWIDGKYIYKKTISVGPLPSSGNKTVQHNISNISRAIKVEGYAYDPNQSKSQFMPFVTSGGNGQASVSVTSSNIEVVVGSDRSSYTEAYVTIYYIKTS